MVGITESADFPVTNALQPRLAGGLDAFVAKLRAGGSGLEFSTFLGSSRLAWSHYLFSKYRADYDALFPAPLDPALDRT